MGSLCDNRNRVMSDIKLVVYYLVVYVPTYVSYLVVYANFQNNHDLVGNITSFPSMGPREEAE